MRYDMFWDSFETCLHGALLEMLKIDINFNNCKTCLRKKQNQLGYMFYDEIKLLLKYPRKFNSKFPYYVDTTSYIRENAQRIC